MRKPVTYHCPVRGHFFRATSRKKRSLLVFPNSVQHLAFGLVLWSHESIVRFGSALFSARFNAIGPVGDSVVMGAKIEQMAGAIAHRLSAQRALTIPAFVQPRAYEQAECTLLHGNYDPGQRPEQRAASKFGNRCGDEPASRMLGDFEHVLALLFADEAKRNREYSRAALKTLPKDQPQKCKLDTLSEIWLAAMPQRTLTIYDDKIDAHTPSGKKYEARQMSDSKRVTVFLVGQALCAPANAIIIIDEPEIHLHQAIQGLLWDKV